MKKLTYITALVLSLIFIFTGCGKVPSYSDLLPAETEGGIRETANDEFGNAYRAYVMGKQVVKDFLMTDPDGARSYDVYDHSVTGNQWSYVSLIDMMENLLTLFPGDEELLADYENALLGMEYYGSIAKRGKWLKKVYCTQASSKKWNSTAVVSYDDSAHTARMFMDAYEKLGDPKWLEKGKNQIDFLIDDAYIAHPDVEAFYWCDESNIVAPVENTMLVYDFLRLYSYLSETERVDPDNLITLREDEMEEGIYWTVDGDDTRINKYLYYAQKAFKWCQKLYDRSTNTYSLQTGATYENGTYEKGKETGTSGLHPVRDNHVGFMISACVAMYEFSGDESYLDQAVRDMQGFYDNFFVEYDMDGEIYMRPMLPNNWLLNKYVRSLWELSQYRYAEASVILGEIQKTIDYAYENSMIDNYINPLFLTGWMADDARCQNYQLLDTSSHPLIYVYLRLWERGIYFDMIDSM